jgi:hypothetical protein
VGKAGGTEGVAQTGAPAHCVERLVD